MSVYHFYPVMHVVHTPVLLCLCCLSICLGILSVVLTIMLGYCKGNYTDKRRVFTAQSPIISNLFQKEHSQNLQGMGGRVIFTVRC